MTRTAKVSRKTSETDIEIELNIDGTGKYEIDTGVNFFNHMLESFSRHSFIDLKVKAIGVFHDRFLILDDKELYHLGASMKDLGRQYCAVSKMDAMFIPSILERI